MASPAPRHVLLTRFSYRSPRRRAAGGDWDRRADPLEPRRLAYRFALFETVCLPNVLAQTSQDFDWVLVVDPELPARERARLARLVERRGRSHLHDIRPGDDLDRTGWLEPYLPTREGPLLTTLLDDDDLLSRSYVQRLHDHVRARGPDAPPVATLGTRTSWQWDLFVSARRPFGTVAPWNRGRWVRAPGFSLLSRPSVHDVSCIALSHTIADVWFEEGGADRLAAVLERRWGPHGRSAARMLGRVEAFQRRLLAGDGGRFWSGRPAEDLFHDLGADGAFVVQTNHFANDQIERLVEPKPSARPVDPEAFLDGGVVVDWEAFERHAPLFRRSRVRHLAALLRVVTSPTGAADRSARRRLRSLGRVASWLRGG